MVFQNILWLLALTCYCGIPWPSVRFCGIWGIYLSLQGSADHLYAQHFHNIHIFHDCPLGFRFLACAVPSQVAYLCWQLHWPRSQSCLAYWLVWPPPPIDEQSGLFVLVWDQLSTAVSKRDLYLRYRLRYGHELIHLSLRRTHSAQTARTVRWWTLLFFRRFDALAGESMHVREWRFSSGKKYLLNFPRTISK